MKKISIILAALATAFAVSCNKEAADIDTTDPSVPAGMKEVTISASIDDTATKTSYDAAGKFSWTKGDQISVLASDGNFYTFTAAGSAASTTFSGAIPEGTTIGTYALYPADANHTYDVNEYYPFGFNIPNYKDLSNTNSADLPLHAESADGTNFPFKHMSGGFKFKVNNFDDIFKTAEVSIVTTGLKISGSFQVRKSSTHSGYVTYATTTSDANELSYIRKVNVVDHSVEVYFPYSPGNDLWGTTTITVVGYDSENNPSQLLRKSASFGGVNHVRGEIIPVTALELPVYVPPVDWTKVDWNSVDESQSYVQPEWFITSYPGRVALSELRVIADDNYVYARVKPYAGADVKKIRFKFADTIGGETEEWYWSTSYTSAYKSSWADVTDNEFTLDYNGYPVELQVEVVDEDVYWNLAFPRIAHELTKSSGTVYFGILSYGAGTDSESDYENGFVPMIWNEMMTVTLP